MTKEKKQPMKEEKKVKLFEEKFEEIRKKHELPICKTCGRTVDTFPDEFTVNKYAVKACHQQKFYDVTYLDLHCETTELLIDDLATSLHQAHQEIKELKQIINNQNDAKRN